MIKNLSQLKKFTEQGTRFEIVSHCRPECNGQQREITVSNTQGFYSVVFNEPEHEISKANNHLGSVLWWSKAPFWSFENGLCSLYSSDKERTEEYHIISFRMENVA